MKLSPIAGLAAGTLAGLALTAAVVVGVGTDAGPAAKRGAEQALIGGLAPLDSRAAAGFLDAWRRSRVITYAADGVFVREAGTRRLQSTLRLAQRPPDRLSVGIGAVSGRRGDRRLACAVDATGVLRCREEAGAPAYAAEVDAEVADLAALITDRPGSLAIYAVGNEGGGCFTLRIRFGYPAPPYGDEARFCFDPATGVPVESVIEREGAVDRTVWVNARTAVIDADLQPPAALEAPDVPAPSAGSSGSSTTRR